MGPFKANKFEHAESGGTEWTEKDDIYLLNLCYELGFGVYDCDLKKYQETLKKIDQENTKHFDNRVEHLCKMIKKFLVKEKTAKSKKKRGSSIKSKVAKVENNDEIPDEPDVPEPEN